MSKINAPTPNAQAVTESEPAPHPNGELAQICGEVAAVFRHAWGRGPAKTTAHGHIQELLGGRHLLQVIIEPDLTASVERILGRRVETTLSATRLDPDLSAEIFLLAPDEC